MNRPHIALVVFGMLFTSAFSFAQSRSPACSPAALLTYEYGKIVGAVWEERTPERVHTHTVLMQSRVIESTIHLRPDATAARSVSTINMEGMEKPNQHSLGEGAIYWSDMNASSIEQAVLRARSLGGKTAHFQGASLFSDARNDITVERIDPTDWVVDARSKRYLVLTDEQGCMLAATLPDYGVTIERRTDFAPEQYPLWPPYAAPPDHAYGASEVKVPASQGIVLAGTLTTPPHTGLIPAAVLITGLSPSERNGGSPPWMPLRDIADALTRAGIAVLRVDDRGKCWVRVWSERVP